MKQVIVRLKGGLGNQMFQYAFGKYFSLRTNSKLIFDLHYLNNPLPSETKREFDLAVFGLNLEFLSNKDSEQLNKQPSYFSRFLQKIKLSANDFQLINDSNYGLLLDQELKEVKRFILDGYFQDYRIVNKYREELLKDFDLQNRIEGEDNNLVNFILDNNVVSVHVRRGDYIHNPHAASHHYSQPITYYNQALSIFRDQFLDAKFLFFSDDIKWCKENFANADTYFCEDVNNSAANDLKLMQLCNHHVIANSSFSWWGAWLSKKKGIVIAPKIWFNDPTTSVAQLIPDTWKKL
jgi:hypothetical protein